MELQTQGRWGLLYQRRTNKSNITHFGVWKQKWALSLEASYMRAENVNTDWKEGGTRPPREAKAMMMAISPNQDPLSRNLRWSLFQKNWSRKDYVFFSSTFICPSPIMSSKTQDSQETPNVKRVSRAKHQPAVSPGRKEGCCCGILSSAEAKRRQSWCLLEFWF